CATSRPLQSGVRPGVLRAAMPVRAAHQSSSRTSRGTTVCAFVECVGGGDHRGRVTLRPGRLELAKIDVDAEQTLAARYGIQSIPTAVVFRGGEPVSGFVGARRETNAR